MERQTNVYWLHEAGPSVPTEPLLGDTSADVVVIGGGYAGLWTAAAIRERAPDARVIVLEAGRCGEGPSGRNAGFANALWHHSAQLVELFGERAALAVCGEASASLDAIGEWAAERGVDVWYRQAGHLKVAASAAQQGRWTPSIEACERLGQPHRYSALSAEQVAERCSSPRLGAGAIMPETATVQPARLALGLRDALVDEGVCVHECSGARRIAARPGGVSIETARGRVDAGAAVVAVGPAAAGFRPLRGRLAVTSTHMVITEPVPDVLERIGWTGGEAISTAATYVNYFRTTPDGRIAFGWGGGRVAFGARLGGRIEHDPRISAKVRSDLVAIFPELRGRRITHAWGGPVDVSPLHHAVVGSLAGERVHYVYGFTGNGVGQAHLAGRILADLALDERTDLTRLALVEPPHAPVPPEPLRYIGGGVVRGALLRRERREDAGLRPGLLTELIAEMPRRLGFHIGR